jgi:hypothetical protein
MRDERDMFRWWSTILGWSPLASVPVAVPVTAAAGAEVAAVGVGPPVTPAVVVAEGISVVAMVGYLSVAKWMMRRRNPCP